MINPDRAQAIVESFRNHRVLVLGDLILDRYVWGACERISPEAPVPVVRVKEESIMLGGAGNVARNLASLGSQVQIVAVVGEDDAARELSRLFSDWKIDSDGLAVDAERPTTQKTRIIARGQQVVRYDRESDNAIAASAAEKLLSSIRARAVNVDGVVIEDYGKGLLTPELLRDVMTIFREHDVRIFVDPKEAPWDVFHDAELVKPNLREAEQITGIRVRGPEDIERLGRATLTSTRAQNVAITRGEEGVTLFSADGTEHVPTSPRGVSDVAGAGDTAISVLALARLSGASWLESAELANSAAGFVVGIAGTAALSPAELMASVRADFVGRSLRG